MSMYSVNSESLTSIADEIRGKTGLVDEMTLEQMAIDAASLPGRLVDVPSYVQAEAKRVAAAVKALQNENTISFIAMSDVHVGSDAQSRASALHAAQGAKIISKLVPIDFTAVLGDVVTGAASDSLTVHLGNHMYALRTTAIVDPALRLSGNHDANIYNADCYQTAEDVYRFTGRFSRGVKPSTEVERNYFYFDLTEKKTRIICLNTADLKDIPAIGSNGNAGNKDGHHISAAQFEWFISALDMTGKTGWRVIVLSHHPLHWYGSMPNVLTLLDAYVAGASGSITADSASISYDFAGKNAAKLVATFHGHTHNLIHGKAGTAEIIRMGTPNACYGRSNEYGSTAYGEDFRSKYGETTTYNKTANSATDTAFCVYTIDFADEVVYATCYGAGYDRIMSYADAVYYIVQNNLTNVTTNNPIGAVENGSVYSATLTANDGYSIGTVTITMGGVDITASAYNNGVITINNVTGEIVIAASANKLPESVDIAAIGYTDNARWSAGDGTIRTGVTGYTAINEIPFERAEGQTVTITLGGGVNWSYDGSKCVLALFVDGAFKMGAYLNTTKTDANAGVNIIANGDGSVTVIIYDSIQSAWKGMDAFKVSGYGSGANAEITISYK